MATTRRMNLAVLVALTCCVGASAQLVSENFDNYGVGPARGQGGWCEDAPGQTHLIAPGINNKAMAIQAINGFASRLSFAQQEIGVFRCSFDFQPKRSMWTAIGIKAPTAQWDQYQAAVFFGPIDDFIYAATPKGHVKISTKPLSVGDQTAVVIYRVEMTIRVAAADKKAGSYRVKVTCQQGVVAQTEWMPFAFNANEPISMFEARSIAWSTARDPINGLLDNLVIENDPETMPFSVSASCDKWGQVYFQDKPVVASVTMTNASDKSLTVPATLSVIDVYGKTVFTKPLKIAVSGKQKASASEPLPAEAIRRFGLYTVKITAGAGVARQNAQTTFAVIAPPVANRDSFNSHFGIFQYPLEEERPYLDKIADQMHDIGATWIRLNLHWCNVESEKGKFNWGVMGDFIDLMYQRDMHVMAEYAYTAKWASSRPDDERGGAVDTGTYWMSVAPKDFADWENFCREGAKRFGDKVTYYEIWNEPGAPRDYSHFDGFWRDSSENYVKLVKTARKAILSVDPDAKLVVGGFRHVDMGAHFDNFIERVMPELINDIDVLSIHGWMGGCTTRLHDLRLITKLLGRPNMRYFDTESPGLGHYSLVGGYLDDWANGMEKSFGFIYNLPRYPHNSMVNADYTPRVSLVAFSTMARMLEGAEMEGQIALGSGIRAYSLMKNRQRIIVAWSEVPDQPMTGVFMNAKQTYDYMGNPGPAVTAGEYRANRVVVGNTPVYVICDLDLDLKGIDREKKQ